MYLHFKILNDIIRQQNEFIVDILYNIQEIFTLLNIHSITDCKNNNLRKDVTQNYFLIMKIKM